MNLRIVVHNYSIYHDDAIFNLRIWFEVMESLRPVNGLLVAEKGKFLLWMALKLYQITYPITICISYV